MLNRRLTVALAATAAAGISAAGMASTAAAAKKNQIVIRGKLEWRAGKGVSDNQRFLPLNAKVKSGATVTVLNKAKTEDPHTLSFVRRRSCRPTGEFSPASAGPLFGLHDLARRTHRAGPADRQRGTRGRSGGEPGGRHARHRPGRRRLAAALRQGAGQVRRDGGRRLQAPLLLHLPPLDAGQDQRQVATMRSVLPRGRGRRHFTRGLAALALPALAFVVGPPPASAAATRDVWVAAVPTTWNAVPNARDAIHGTHSRPPRRRSPPSSTGAIRAAGASRCGCPTRRAAAPGGSTAR